MRTTLDIEDDVLQAAKELAKHEGGTTGQMLSAWPAKVLPLALLTLPPFGMACLYSLPAAKLSLSNTFKN